MGSLISIVEISTNDFSRAVKFYRTILGVNIEEVDMDGTQMGILQSDNGTVNVCLVKEFYFQYQTASLVLFHEY